MCISTRASRSRERSASPLTFAPTRSADGSGDSSQLRHLHFARPRATNRPLESVRQHMNPTLPSGRIPTASDTSSSAQGNGAPQHKLRESFRRFSGITAAAVGSPWAFTIAVLAIIVWAALGPHFHYSDTWQLVINTGTTIVTFLMVFLIQNTQNRDARAIHLKLDELIKGTKGSRNMLVDLENCTDEELNELEAEFKRVRERHERRRHQPHGHEQEHEDEHAQ